MKKAIIIYNSHTGITKKYAEALGSFLQSKNIEIRIKPISEYDKNMSLDADYLMLGSWTSGLFLFGQHPDKEWVKFAQQFPQNTIPNVVFFTTYKLATGTMFKNMKKHLSIKAENIKIELKSRNGKLSDFDMAMLENLLK
jgi:flavodoxin